MQHLLPVVVLGLVKLQAEQVTADVRREGGGGVDYIRVLNFIIFFNFIEKVVSIASLRQERRANPFTPFKLVLLE